MDLDLLSLPSVTLFFRFHYKGIGYISGVGHFAEFLFMFKRDSETSRPELIHSLDGFMPIVSSFQIYWNIDSIIGSLDFTPETKYTNLG